MPNYHIEYYTRDLLHEDSGINEPVPYFLQRDTLAEVTREVDTWFSQLTPKFPNLELVFVRIHSPVTNTWYVLHGSYVSLNILEKVDLP